MDVMSADTESSEYERLREENIRRNNEMLRSLGLLRADSDRISTFSLLKQRHSSSSDQNRTPKQRRKRKRTETRTSNGKRGPRRQSRRLKGEKAELVASALDIPVDLEEDENDADEEEDPDERRRAKLRAANEVAKAGGDVAAMENPTASYEHCLKRVRSMSEKRLKTRIKVIERAAGRHCVVKMAIFVMVLNDEGLPEIAELANAALERLKAMAPPE